MFMYKFSSPVLQLWHSTAMFCVVACLDIFVLIFSLAAFPVGKSEDRCFNSMRLKNSGTSLLGNVLAPSSTTPDPKPLNLDDVIPSLGVNLLVVAVVAPSQML